MVSIAELDVSVMGNYFFLLKFKNFLNVLGFDINEHFNKIFGSAGRLVEIFYFLDYDGAMVRWHR